MTRSIDRIIEALEKAGTSAGAKLGWDKRGRGRKAPVKVTRGTVAPKGTPEQEASVQDKMKEEADYKKRHPAFDTLKFYLHTSTLDPASHNDYAKRLSEINSVPMLSSIKNSFQVEYDAQQEELGKPLSQRRRLYGSHAQITNINWAMRLIDDAIKQTKGGAK